MTMPPPSPDRPEPRPAGPRLMAIASGKGGVGKTWLSASLAHALSFGGRSVLLVDGDFGLANVDVQLGLDPGTDLGGLIAGNGSLESAVTPFAGGHKLAGKGGFDILAGRSGSGALGALGLAQLKRLGGAIVSAASSYDHVLLDVAAGIDGPVTFLCQMAETVLVVVTDEPTSLTDAYALIKVLSRARPQADLRIIVNMAQSLSEGRRTHQALARAARQFLAIDPPLEGIVRRDAHVKDAIRAQSPILTKFPQSQASRDIETLAEGLSRQGRSGQPLADRTRSRQA